jgi:hypothetical protein
LTIFLHEQSMPDLERDYPVHLSSYVVGSTRVTPVGDIVRYLRSENIADLAGLFELTIGGLGVLGYLVFVRMNAVKSRTSKTRRTPSV